MVPRSSALAALLLQVAETNASMDDLIQGHQVGDPGWTDKERFGHAYVSVYEMLFAPIRNRVRNITEIGVFLGGSLPLWHGYFPNAHVWAIDVTWQAQAAQVAQALGSRVSYLIGNSKHRNKVAEFGLARESMDIVIDDGGHSPHGNMRTLLNLWPLVKPGGYYIVEDITTGSTAEGNYLPGRRRDPSGFSWMAHNGTHWPKQMRDIYEQNDVFFADTLVGAIDFPAYQRSHLTWVIDRANHNSHLLVIKKRSSGPRMRSYVRPELKVAPISSRASNASLKTTSQIAPGALGAQKVVAVASPARRDMWWWWWWWRSWR